MPDFWYLSSVSLKILSYFYKPKNMAILGNLWSFWHKKRLENRCFQACGRGIRIRTLNDGVRVRSVTVTLYLYILPYFRTAIIIILQNLNLSRVNLHFFYFFIILMSFPKKSRRTAWPVILDTNRWE